MHKTGKYIKLQNELVERYRIILSDGHGCRGRTHAHVKERKICKWKASNGLSSTFTLLHEIGHIETTKSYMRRAESEYFATDWALRRCAELKLDVPQKTIDIYQRYVDMELDRGLRRGGTGYDRQGLRLKSYYKKGE